MLKCWLCGTKMKWYDWIANWFFGSECDKCIFVYKEAEDSEFYFSGVEDLFKLRVKRRITTQTFRKSRDNYLGLLQEEIKWKVKCAGTK